MYDSKANQCYLNHSEQHTHCCANQGRHHRVGSRMPSRSLALPSLVRTLLNFTHTTKQQHDMQVHYCQALEYAFHCSTIHLCLYTRHLHTLPCLLLHAMTRHMLCIASPSAATGKDCFCMCITLSLTVKAKAVHALAKRFLRVSV